MPKDNTNIFKLDKATQKLYVDAPFFDCLPNAEEYANCLLSEIKVKPTPYVKMVESGFGMGKTFFFTRFTQFLRNKNVNCIYFSAWESDYIESPLEAFSKEILCYFHNLTLKKTVASYFQGAAVAILELVNNVAKAVKIDFLNMEKGFDAVKVFLDRLIKEKDSINKFKIELQKFIKHLPNKKLVLIVDELDRCRPDYAMKVLELIKHFFDIEGLFVILPTNQNSLDKCVQSLYGFNEDKESSECYFRKFFDDIDCLYEPDYLKFVQDIITLPKLQKAFDKSRFSYESGKYNSLDTLHVKLSEFCKCEKFTLRETVMVCENVIQVCNHLKDRLDCEYLAYKVCQKFSRIQKSKLSLSEEHPFLNHGFREKVLTWQVPQDVYKLGNTSYPQSYDVSYSEFTSRKFSSYQDFYDFYDKLKKSIAQGFKPLKSAGTYSTTYSFSCNAHIVEEALENMFKGVKVYQEKWGSNDKDNDVKNYYDDIVEREYKLYEGID